MVIKIKTKARNGNFILKFSSWLFAVYEILRLVPSCFSNLCESVGCGVDGFLNILRVVGQREEIGFKLGRRQINALFQHGMEINFEGLQVAGGGAVKIRNGLIAEKDGEHAAQAVYLHGYAGFGCGPFQTAG